jgi:hypothetical protein
MSREALRPNDRPRANAPWSTWLILRRSRYAITIIQQARGKHEWAQWDTKAPSIVEEISRDWSRRFDRNWKLATLGQTKRTLTQMADSGSLSP